MVLVPSYKIELAMACDEGKNGTVSYYNNTCTSVQDICHNFNLTYVENRRDPTTGYTQCFNGTHDIPLEKVIVQ